MNFACYSTWEELPDRDNLLPEAQCESIFYTRPWLENLAENGLESGQQLLLAAVVDNEHTLALLPLMTGKGNGLHALSHGTTTHYSLLLTNHDRERVLDTLARGLAQLPYDHLGLAPVAEDDTNIAALQHALERHGYSCTRHFRFYNWIHRLQQESFAGYIASRPGRLRSTIARKKRKLAREHGYEISLYSGRDMDRALQEYNRIYSASWKATEVNSAILEGLTSRFAAQGWIRIAVLYVDQQPVAAQVWFVANGRASIYRLVHDEAWKHYSPGSILTEYLVRHVIEQENVIEIDFLTGNERYKQDWMSERRKRFLLNCIREKSTRPRGGKIFQSITRLIKR